MIGTQAFFPALATFTLPLSGGLAASLSWRLLKISGFIIFSETKKALICWLSSELDGADSKTDWSFGIQISLTKFINRNVFSG